MRRPSALTLTLSLAVALLAAATPAAAREPGITVDLGFGGAVRPAYPGASGHSVGPTGGFGFRELVLPGGFGIGTIAARPVDPGFGLRGALRYMPARRPADHPELAGLASVKASLELGLGWVWVGEAFRVFAEARHGVVGHGGWAGDLGADLIWRPAPGTAVLFGPRLGFGDRRFAATYFGVTGAESAASGLSAWRPGGGMLSAGLELGLNHAIDDDWGFEGRLGWDRLQGGAADSPITAQGARDQWSVRLIVTRRFTFGR